MIDNDTIESNGQLPELPELSQELTHEEMSNSRKQLSSGKSSGKDSLPPEVFKFGVSRLVKKQHELFIQI